APTRVGDGDRGPNTGGMGAYAPLPWAPPGLAKELVAEVVAPVAAELERRGTPFSGLLYAGLALTSAGPAAVEFNCRFGDPETQVVLALLRTPLASRLPATAGGGAAAPPPGPGAPPPPPGSATSRAAPRPRACCTRAPAAATTAPSCPRADGCSR